MDPSVPVEVLVFAAFGPPLILLHELGHALAALALTRGDVRVTVGVGPAAVLLRQDRLEVRLALLPVAGLCEYDPRSLERSRAEAWIALAGPAASLGACVLLFATAMFSDGMVSAIAFMGALAAAAHVLLSATPLRYGAGIGPGDSDGRVAWLVLTGGRARPPRDRPERVIHPVLAVLLAGITVLATWMSPWMGIALVVLFGLGYRMQRAGD